MVALGADTETTCKVKEKDEENRVVEKEIIPSSLTVVEEAKRIHHERNTNY
ncbi:MAG: hypothetical protein Tsb0021_05960 [Chlamydiales bacterium]